MIVRFSEFGGLSETIQYNKNLCPDVWDGDKLDNKIRSKLVLVAKDFINSNDILKAEGIVTDIILTGSLTNYNWTSSSDFDLHIKADFSRMGGDVEMLTSYFIDEKTVWNYEHDITLKGYPVEIYVEDVNAFDKTAYSVLYDRWVVKPVWKEPVVDDAFIDKKVESYVRLIDYIVRKSGEDLDTAGLKELYKKAKAVRSDIVKKRKDNMKTATDEFGEYNIIFKKLRSLGYLEKIYDVVGDLYDRYYSL